MWLRNLMLVGGAFAAASVTPTSANGALERNQDQESYRGARAAVTRGDVDRALELLGLELEGGFDVAQIMGDAVWNELRGDARFKALVRQHATSSTSRIAPYGEPGEQLAWEVAVVDGNGAPIAGALVYAYQSDAAGVYSAPDDSSHNPRLYGYAVTDDHGQVSFQTVAPGSYPNSGVPRHIHYSVETAGRPQHGGRMLFDDDPLLTDAARKDAARHGWPTAQVEAADRGVVARGQIKVSP